MFYFSLISDLFNARKNYLEELDLIETRCKTISERINVLDHGQNDEMLEEKRNRLNQAQLLIKQTNRNLNRVFSFVYLKVPMITNHYKQIRELNIKLREDIDNLPAIPPSHSSSILRTVYDYKLHRDLFNETGQQINIKLRLIQNQQLKEAEKHSHNHNQAQIIIQKTFLNDTCQNMVLHTFKRQDYNGKNQIKQHLSKEHATITCERRVEQRTQRKMMIYNDKIENNELEYVYEFTLTSKATNIIFIRQSREDIENQIILKNGEQQSIYRNNIIVFKVDQNMEIELGYEFQFRIEEQFKQ